MAELHQLSEHHRAAIEAPPWIGIGKTGLDYDGAGYVRDEWLPDLAGERAARKYREMYSNNAICGSYYYTVTTLAQQTPKSIVPANDSPMALFVRDRIEEMLDDMSHTWSEFISDAISMVPHGYSLHEVVYKIRRGWNPDHPELNSKHNDGLVGLRKIPIRHQETVKRWEFECDGGVLGAYQQPPPDYTERFIPLNRSALFRVRSNKNSPEGLSVFRPAYRSWYFLKRTQEYEMIGVSRDMAGILALRLPPEYFRSDATASQKQTLENMKSLVQKIRRGEYEGLVFPGTEISEGKTGWDAHLLQSGGRRPMDVDGIIKRLESRIAIALMGEHVLLGMQGNVGAWSLADMKLRMSAMVIDALMQNIADVFNRFVFVRLVAENHWPTELTPTLEFGDIDTSNITEQMPAIATALQGGLIAPGPEVEQHVRERLGIPMETEPSIGQFEDAVGSLNEKSPMQQEIEAADAVEAQVPIEQEKSATVSLDEIADMWGISRNRVRNAIRRGQLPGFQVGREMVVPREDFDAWRQSRGAAGE